MQTPRKTNDKNVDEANDKSSDSYRKTTINHGGLKGQAGKRFPLFTAAKTSFFDFNSACNKGDSLTLIFFTVYNIV